MPATIRFLDAPRPHEEVTFEEFNVGWRSRVLEWRARAAGANSARQHVGYGLTTAAALADLFHSINGIKVADDIGREIIAGAEKTSRSNRFRAQG